MKRLGLYLLKNNIHIMTLIFVCTTIFAGIHWVELALIQKLLLGAYLCLIVHEYEEGYKGKFIAIMTTALQVDTSQLLPGATHIAQAVYITGSFLIALLFPEQLWLTFATFILCIFELFVHTMGSFLFRLHRPSPGWYTAFIMGCYAIWAIVYFNAHAEYAGIQWLWAALWFVGLFLLLEAWFQHIIGNRMSELPKKMQSYIRSLREE